MRAVAQRVTRASVSVEGKEIGRIGRGLVALVGVEREDGEADARYLAEKIAHLRVFPDEGGRFQRSLLEVGGEVLVVSQFTLLGDTRKGRRPSFDRAAPAEVAAPLIERLVSLLQERGLSVATGRFQAAMLVEIHNDGPVTLLLDSRP